MKVRLLSPALRGRFGEVVEADDMPKGLVEKWLKQGVAQLLKKAAKKTTESKKKAKAENTSASG